MEFERSNKVYELVSSLDNDKIKVVIGLRRVGKSYLLNHIFKNHLIDNCGYIEDDFLILHLIETDYNIRTIEQLRDKIFNSYRDKKFKILIVDEVQMAGEKYYDPIICFHKKYPNVQIFVTGSNSYILSDDIIRDFDENGISICLFPLTYKEIKKEMPEFTVHDYMEYGGIPEILLDKKEKRKKELMRLFKKTYISDLRDRYKFAYLNVSSMETILVDRLSTVSSYSEKNVTNKISGKIKDDRPGKLALNKEIVDFLNFCENAFLLEEVVDLTYADNEHDPFYDTERKFYCSDNGIRYAVGNPDRKDDYVFENAVFLELKRHGINPSTIGVVKTNGNNGEIDFSFSYNGENFVIQVAYSITPFNYDREIGNLLNYDQEARKIVIYVENMTNEVNDVEYWPAENFFLNFFA